MQAFFSALGKETPPDDDWIFNWLILERDWIQNDTTAAPLLHESLQEWKLDLSFQKRLGKYNAFDSFALPSDAQCPICLETIQKEAYRTRCGHIFESFPMHSVSFVWKRFKRRRIVHDVGIFLTKNVLPSG